MEKVSVRKFPYPFKASLCICSDIDGTDTVEDFLAIQTYLNTTRQTSLGQGIGLEIGNSFLPTRVKDTFAYFSKRPQDREIIKTFIRAGFIDCLHSYGERTFTRHQVLTILEALDHDGCKLKTWIDHSAVPSNLGPDNSQGLGDVPDSPVYHADLSLAYGFKFAWMGRGTDVLGQEVPFTSRAFTRIFDPTHPWSSLKHLLRQSTKTILSQVGLKRLAIHRRNLLLQPTRLRDGNRIFEFIRCNNHWHKPRPSSLKLAYMLRPQALETLIASGGATILYTHLGFIDPPELIPLPTRAALGHLADTVHKGDLFVTTTTRLLTYCLTHRYLKWDYHLSPGNVVHITIKAIDDPITGLRPPTPEEIQGITFYVPDRQKVSLRLGDQRLSHITRNAKDHRGQESISVPWTPLSYPL
jgi:hypothetical protein